MEEIAAGIWSWSTFHEGIGYPVRSHLVVAGGEAVVVDPRVPEEGLERVAEIAAPVHALLTNRHHHRHAEAFRERFGLTVWCHEAGLHEFAGTGAEVEAFGFGDELPGGFRAEEVATLCPEETALHHAGASALALGDAAVHQPAGLDFVPEPYIGDDPEGVKAGLRRVLGELVERLEFRHLLLAHGDPIVDEGRERLREFAS